jgi:hypothetical protein
VGTQGNAGKVYRQAIPSPQSRLRPRSQRARTSPFYPFRSTATWLPFSPSREGPYRAQSFYNRARAASLALSPEQHSALRSIAKMHSVRIE